MQIRDSYPIYTGSPSTFIKVLFPNKLTQPSLFSDNKIYALIASDSAISISIVKSSMTGQDILIHLPIEQTCLDLINDVYTSHFLWYFYSAIPQIEWQLLCSSCHLGLYFDEKLQKLRLLPWHLFFCIHFYT
ncbi:hypothetical protein NQ317_009076 [Molorchus minor]|uniref:Uncharacterized protein n=1 Tax=Molorchus minor TaxID=1323400 RepID=A0ABQ9IS76_9CUCU|nr:hypothetical protein NQ317_009076 [Molorchus minor]